MSGFICSLVGASFGVAAAPEVIRRQNSVIAFADAQVDTAQSKFGGASAYFDGTDDYLAVSPVRIPETGDFTIEFWHRPANTGERFDLVCTNTTANGRLITNTTTSDQFQAFIGVSGANVLLTSSSTYSANVWYHYAFVRSGNNFYLYVDGNLEASDTTGVSRSVAQVDTWIGTRPNVPGDAAKGHIDEVRISNTARYTTGFTPSTTPFVNDENTLLLLHMDGTDASTTFVDDNGIRSKKGITAIANAQVDTAQSKFGGASALFDGVGDRLSVISDFSQSGDFTFECWFRPGDTSGNQAIMAIGDESAGRQNIYLNGSTPKLNLYGGADSISSSTTVSANNWYHIAIVRSSTTVTMYLEGSNVGSATISGTFGNANGLFIGDISSGAISINGHIDEVRISNVARYTTGFTPSTTGFINDSNTLLLLHMDGTDGSTYFEDDNGVRAKLGVIANGNAQVDTAQSNFGGASALFDGTGAYLVIPTVGGDLDIGTDWTLECWYRPNAKTGNFPCIIGNHFASWTAGDWEFFDRHNSANTKFTFWANSYNSGTPMLTSTTSVNNGTWYHLAIVKNGTSWKMYINGTEESAVTSSVSMGTGRNHYIGSSNTGTVNSLNGWIDELRISNTSRYTANFTPSTTPFQNDSNTLLLLHMDGTDASTVFTDDNGVNPDYTYP